MATFETNTRIDPIAGRDPERKLNFESDLASTMASTFRVRLA